MRTSFTFLIVCLFPIPFLSTAWAADLNTYRDVYQKESQEILVSFQPRFDGLQQQYQKSLDGLKTAAQKQGDLVKIKAAIAESERFQKEKRLPATLTETEIPEIKALQSAYVKQFTLWERDMTAQLGTLTAKYVQALDRLQKELVKALKLDEATAVQVEKEKAQASIKGYAEQISALAGPAATNAPSGTAAAQTKEAPAPKQAVPEAPPVDLKERVRLSFAQDRKTYNSAECEEIERLYQITNKRFKSPEAKECLQALIKKYPRANRTGCALLYMGQMSSGEEQEDYLKQAIKDFGDCYYGDGVQVGAYARFCLAVYYRRSGKDHFADSLKREVLKDYPDAVDHTGRLLKDLFSK